jgi:hypothetical protein
MTMNMAVNFQPAIETTMCHLVKSSESFIMLNLQVALYFSFIFGKGAPNRQKSHASPKEPMTIGLRRLWNHLLRKVLSWCFI